MNNQEKELLYYKIGASQSRTGKMPPFIPSRVRTQKWNRGDFIFADIEAPPGDYACNCNKFGAVSVKASNGKMLGLRLDEFEVLEWKENPFINEVKHGSR
jgi:hypothetical protein